MHIHSLLLRTKYLNSDQTFLQKLREFLWTITKVLMISSKSDEALYFFKLLLILISALSGNLYLENNTNNRLTLLLATDGKPMVKSDRSSCWPVSFFFSFFSR